jgi:hypothetical protein
VDVLVAHPREFDRAQLARRQSHLLSKASEHPAYVASPEDTVLSKLECYRLGSALPEQRWRDLVSVLKAQRAHLDQKYLRQMAFSLGMTDLLRRAIDEASLP